MMAGILTGVRDGRRGKEMTNTEELPKCGNQETGETNGSVPSLGGNNEALTINHSTKYMVVVFLVWSFGWLVSNNNC